MKPTRIRAIASGTCLTTRHRPELGRHVGGILVAVGLVALVGCGADEGDSCEAAQNHAAACGQSLPLDDSCDPDLAADMLAMSCDDLAATAQRSASQAAGCAIGGSVGSFFTPAGTVIGCGAGAWIDVAFVAAGAALATSYFVTNASQKQTPLGMVSTKTWGKSAGDRVSPKMQAWLMQPTQQKKIAAAQAGTGASSDFNATALKNIAEHGNSYIVRHFPKCSPDNKPRTGQCSEQEYENDVGCYTYKIVTTTTNMGAGWSSVNYRIEYTKCWCQRDMADWVKGDPVPWVCKHHEFQDVTCSNMKCTPQT